MPRRRGIVLASHDEDLWRRGVAGLRSQVREAMPALRSAVQSGDHNAARQFAHRLAGSAAYVAAVALADCAGALEKACRDEDGAAMEICLAAVDTAARRFLDVDVDADS